MAYKLTVLEAFKESNMWDYRYNLPLGPQNNNPWFYLNLALKVISSTGESIPISIWERVASHAKACEKMPGLYHRWPRKPDEVTSDVTSHDELIGMASLSSALAENIYKYLVEHDGEYNNTELPDPFGQWNLSRFFWFMTWLKSRAGIKISLLSQAAWAVHVVYDICRTTYGTQDASGRLLIWTMLPEMEKYWLTGAVVDLWRWRMKKLEITPKTMLALEPKENPILAQCAPLQF